VVQNPDAIAAELGGEQLSYQQLNEQANQLAHELIKRGVQPGDGVGLHLPRSLDFLVSLLGVLKAGAVYVTLDTTNPAKRLEQFAQQANLVTVLSHSAVVSEAVFSNTVYLDEQQTRTALSAQPTHNPALALTPESPAFAYFTSGSTGAPKAALNSHRGVVNAMQSMADELELQTGDRVLQFASLGFDVVIEEVLPAWFSGATVVLRDEEGLLSSGQFQALLERNRISVCELMASYWNHWCSFLEEQALAPPESLRRLILGSDRVAMSVYRRWSGYGIPVVNVFGLTETGCTSAVFHAHGEQPFSDYLPNGRPLANTQLYVLNSTQQVVPEGVVGELYIGGESVGIGYLGDPELTDQRFIDNPFGIGKLYRTGDRARWLSGGNLEFIGRGDSQVKLRGFRIELGEIEAKLEAHESISEAAVMVVGHEENNEETDTEQTHNQLIAYITVKGEAEISQQTVQRHLQQSLPEYMVPQFVQVLDSMPRTSTEKIDRMALPRPSAQALRAEAFEAPQGETEIALAGIWQSLLSVDQVSRHDNFFELET